MGKGVVPGAGEDYEAAWGGTEWEDCWAAEGIASKHLSF